MNSKTMNEISQTYNISKSKIRYLEKNQILGPFNRNQNGIRIFNAHDELEIRAFLKYQQIGFSLNEIKLIKHYHQTNRIPQIIELLDKYYLTIDDKIKQLQDSKIYLQEKKKFLEEI